MAHTAPRFCRSSLLWTWSKYSSAYLGALYLRLLRVGIRKQKVKYSLPILFFGFGMGGFGSYFLADGQWSSMPEYIAILYLATLGIPLGWWMGWKSRANPVNRWLHFDSFLSSVSAIVIIWVAAESYTFDDVAPTILLVAANHWIYQFLRMLEAQGGKNLLSDSDIKQLRSEVPFPVTQDLHREIEWAERLTVFLGVGIFVGLFFAVQTLFSGSHLPQIIFLGIVPLALPFHQALSSKILRRSLKHRVYLPKLNHFKKIATTRHIRSHHLGVFTQPQVKFESWWLDPSAAWTEKEVEELVASMTRDVSHPLCEALHQQFESSDFHVRLADMQNLPHLGLRVSFRNQEGQILNVCLGSLNWFLSEFHDLSPEGHREFQDWFDQSRLACFLSINRRIVAGFSFSSEKKLGETEFFQTLKEQSRPICLFSSSNPAAIQVVENNFEELSLNLLPVEREIQIEHWAERAPSFIELRSTWDHPPSDNAYPIIFGRKPDRVSFENHICILHDSLNSFAWLLSEAEGWKRRKRSAYGLPFFVAGLGLVLCMIPTLLPIPSLSQIAYIIWNRRQN